MGNEYLKRRGDQTFPKTVYLTAFGRDQIEAWAQENQINFSAAIETLALFGLGDGDNQHIIPALRAVTLQGIQLAFNRLAHLLSVIAIDTAVNRSMIEGVMLQLIRELADARPDDFETLMRVPRDSRRQRDIRIRQFHDHFKQGLEKSASQRIRQPLEVFDDLMRGDQDKST